MIEPGLSLRPSEPGRRPKCFMGHIATSANPESIIPEPTLQHTSPLFPPPSLLPLPLPLSCPCPCPPPSPLPLPLPLSCPCPCPPPSLLPLPLPLSCNHPLSFSKVQPVLHVQPWSLTHYLQGPFWTPTSPLPSEFTSPVTLASLAEPS
jgi:hypothetical protein